MSDKRKFSNKKESIMLDEDDDILAACSGEFLEDTLNAFQSLTTFEGDEKSVHSSDLERAYQNAKLFLHIDMNMIDADLNQQISSSRTRHSILFKISEEVEDHDVEVQKVQKFVDASSYDADEDRENKKNPKWGSDSLDFSFSGDSDDSFHTAEPKVSILNPEMNGLDPIYSIHGRDLSSRDVDSRISLADSKCDYDEETSGVSVMHHIDFEKELDLCGFFSGSPKFVARSPSFIKEQEREKKRRHKRQMYFDRNVIRSDDEEDEICFGNFPEVEDRSFGILFSPRELAKLWLCQTDDMGGVFSFDVSADDANDMEVPASVSADNIECVFVQRKSSNHVVVAVPDEHDNAEVDNAIPNKTERHPEVVSPTSVESLRVETVDSESEDELYEEQPNLGNPEPKTVSPPVPCKLEEQPSIRDAEEKTERKENKKESGPSFSLPRNRYGQEEAQFGVELDDSFEIPAPSVASIDKYLPKHHADRSVEETKVKVKSNGSLHSTSVEQADPMAFNIQKLVMDFSPALPSVVSSRGTSQAGRSELRALANTWITNRNDPKDEDEPDQENSGPVVNRGRERGNAAGKGKVQLQVDTEPSFDGPSPFSPRSNNVQTPNSQHSRVSFLTADGDGLTRKPTTSHSHSYHNALNAFSNESALDDSQASVNQNVRVRSAAICSPRTMALEAVDDDEFQSIMDDESGGSFKSMFLSFEDDEDDDDDGFGSVLGAEMLDAQIERFLMHGK